MRCDREGRDLPDDEFEYTDEYGWVHKRGRWHTTGGEDIDPGTLPGPMIEMLMDFDDPSE